MIKALATAALICSYAVPVSDSGPMFTKQCQDFLVGCAKLTHDRKEYKNLNDALWYCIEQYENKQGDDNAGGKKSLDPKAVPKDNEHR